ncbi:MAG: hypothetical protein JO266_12180 [Acidobacteria bacterium]|nr:hypothetical protein [Acidobacteriota bacterium]
MGDPHVQMHPELFAANVGMGEAASSRTMVNIQYDLLLAKARKDGKQTAVKELDAIGGPGPTMAITSPVFTNPLVRAPAGQACVCYLRATMTIINVPGLAAGRAPGFAASNSAVGK